MKSIYDMKSLNSLTFHNYKDSIQPIYFIFCPIQPEIKKKSTFHNLTGAITVNGILKFLISTIIIIIIREPEILFCLCESFIDAAGWE